ncbi:M1 family metallopeptidase [Lentilactobacillus kribbianus]|uniref:M1 family metallopeptidase n=1 Tax=Lentilactobacillus kribbianus TaxID=2729622 RepID=UPI001552C857|nr:M1 family metallopeptidase [Lentilactobacillus kribbianus]
MTKNQHLYEVFQPEHYNLFLDINRETKQISGTTTVTGNAQDTTIALHQKFMTINSVKVAGQAVPFTMDADREAFKIELAQTGEVTITVDYTAPLTDTMMGIYPSYYELNGEKKQIIGTQFETTSARQAFPCVDEPEAKATFDLAIKFDEHEGETILSNMDENRFENGVHYFDTTLRISTYLIAFAFGDLQAKYTTTKSGVKIGVFSTKAHPENELDYPLTIAKKSIEFFEDFYETPYPLSHSWQLALPDFSAGAMENWGLVTYRESYLLFDPLNASIPVKQHTATTISHELAHQWFGDLVTMKWWDDLWLNESFANMMEYVAIDAIDPDLHIWEAFQMSEVPSALQRDATDGVQPVHVAVEDPAEIDALFDSAIVYAKGSRMLVMVRAMIGDDALRTGLKNYFAAHKFGNAKGADLWQALGEAAGMNVGEIMNSWLEQPGFPVVTAAVIDGKLTLSQQQFFIGSGKEMGRQWQIPLAGNYEVVPAIMNDQKLVLGDYEQLRQQNGQAFRLNIGNNSHFIVKYDQTLLEDILASADSLDVISQRQILQDLRLLAEGRQVSFAKVVPVLKQFAASHSALVNQALYKAAADLKMFPTPDSAEENFLRQLYGHLSADQFDRLTWLPKADESNDDQLTRPYILDAALYAKNDAAMKAAHDLFTEHADDLIHLSASVRAAVLTNEVKNYGSTALFDRLMLTYQNTVDPAFKADLSVALTSTTEEASIRKIIVAFENPAIIKPQDLRTWFPQLLENSAAEQAAWDWIRNDWQWLADTIGGDMSFTSYIGYIARAFHTPQRLSEFEAFFEPKLGTPGLTREIQMDINVIKSRINLIEADKKLVNEAVKSLVE